MKTRSHRALSATMASIIALFVLLPLPTRAATDEDTAIAAFLSIGLQAASDEFHSIRGNELGEGEGMWFSALRWPDRTHFASCTVGSSVGDIYSCVSTYRSGSEQALFSMAQRAVIAHLPTGFSTEGPKALGENALIQEWTKGRTPRETAVSIVVREDNGRRYYVLTVTDVAC